MARWTKIELYASIICIYSHMYFNKHLLKVSNVQDTGKSHAPGERGGYKDEWDLDPVLKETYSPVG